MTSLPPPPPLPPPAPPEELHCFRHPGRVTGRRCTRCGRPACPECLVQAAVGAQCVSCVKATAPGRRDQLRRSYASMPTPVTTALIAINASIWLSDQITGGIEVGRYRSLEAAGKLYGGAVRDGDWWRLVSSGFLHAGLTHLLFNMFALYQVGSILERALGTVRYTALYFAALLAGSAGVLIASPDSPTVGASGAIFGLFGALALGMRHRGIDVWKSGIGPLLLINLVITFSIPGISKGGHIGGLVGGAVVGQIMFWADKRKDRTALGVAVAVAVGVAAVVIAMVAASKAIPIGGQRYLE